MHDPFIMSKIMQILYFLPRYKKQIDLSTPLCYTETSSGKQVRILYEHVAVRYTEKRNPDRMPQCGKEPLGEILRRRVLTVPSRNIRTNSFLSA